MQFARIEKDIEDYKKGLEQERLQKINEAKEKEALVECSCCYNDECLLEDMLYCPNSHMYCKECVQRASEASI